MARVKGGTHAIKRRRSVLKRAKGYRYGRGTKEKEAKQATIRAGQHAYAHRKAKKGDFRRLWQIKINAASRALGSSYSVFVDRLKKKNVALDRKTLADLATNKPDAFKRVYEHVNS